MYLKAFLGKILKNFLHSFYTAHPYPQFCGLSCQREDTAMVSKCWKLLALYQAVCVWSHHCNSNLLCITNQDPDKKKMLHLSANQPCCGKNTTTFPPYKLSHLFQWLRQTPPEFSFRVKTEQMHNALVSPCPSSQWHDAWLNIRVGKGRNIYEKYSNFPSNQVFCCSGNQVMQVESNTRMLWGLGGTELSTRSLMA